MRSDTSGFDRSPRPSRDDTGGNVLAGKTGLYLLIGGAALLVVAAGAFFVGMMRAPAQAPRNVAANPAPAQPAPAQPAAPAPLQWTTVGTFGSWEARCTTPPGAKARVCTAVLQVINNANKTVLMSWIVAPDEKGVLQAVFQTPTGVMVSSGVDVKIGNTAARKINFQSCAQQQCTAIGPMNDAFVKEVLAAPKADVTLTALNGRQLNFGIPVAGLDKALAAIKK